MAGSVERVQELFEQLPADFRQETLATAAHVLELLSACPEEMRLWVRALLVANWSEVE